MSSQGLTEQGRNCLPDLDAECRRHIRLRSPASDQAPRLPMRSSHRALNSGLGPTAPVTAFPRPCGVSDPGAAHWSWVWTQHVLPPRGACREGRSVPEARLSRPAGSRNEKHREALLPCTLQGGHRPGNTKPKAPPRTSLFLVLPSATCTVLCGVPGQKPCRDPAG